MVNKIRLKKDYVKELKDENLIYVNDISGYMTITNNPKHFPVSLVIEIDNNLRWYVNPDERNDMILCRTFGIPLDQETYNWLLEDEVIYFEQAERMIRDLEDIAG